MGFFLQEMQKVARFSSMNSSSPTNNFQNCDQQKRKGHDIQVSRQYDQTTQFDRTAYCLDSLQHAKVPGLLQRIRANHVDVEIDSLVFVLEEDDVQASSGGARD